MIKGYDDIWKIISTELSKSAKEASTGSTGSSEDSSTTNSSKSIVTHITEALGLTDPNSKINRVEKKLVSVTNYKTILLYIMSFTLFFACIGFLAAMIFPNTRASFFNDASLKSYYIALILLLAIVVFRMQNWIDNKIVILIIGFILGGFAFYIVNKIVEKRKKDLP